MLAFIAALATFFLGIAVTDRAMGYRVQWGVNIVLTLCVGLLALLIVMFAALFRLIT